MYQALYRKWRPKTFSDVIGQSHITETLRRQVAEDRTSHAYLFTGTRGTGKTTCAKILAKAVNCQHPINGDPCNQCEACRGIDSGSLLDVLELDAASNNGVEQIRALRDEAIYSPAKVKKRVYIVDEVHMLSVSAFNALLKILEEPPAHLMFILATTELHKVPATILSRCQRYSFKRILPADIAARLSYVAEQEHIDLRPDGAELLSRLADGALRDALSLLDQCAAVGGAIDSAAVLDVLGLAGNLQTAQMMELILNRDAQGALLLLDKLYTGGKDVSAVLGELSTLSRDLLLRRMAPQGAAALLSGGYDSALLDGLQKLAGPQRFLYLSSTIQKTAAELSMSANRRTDAELCLLKLCDESLSGDLTAISARLERLETEGIAPQPRGAAAPPKVPAAPERAAAAPQRPRRPAPQPDLKQAERPPWEAPLEAARPRPTPKAEERPPWDEPPLPEAPPEREEPGMVRVFDIPEEASPERAAPAPREIAAPPPTPEQESVPQVQEAPSGAIAQTAIPQTAIPQASASAASAPIQGSLDGSWWRTVVGAAKGQLPPMNRAFLEMCSGVLQGGELLVFAPDELTVGRLDNDRVKGVLQAETAATAGVTPRVLFRVGEAPQASPQENFQNLLKFGSQFDNITIK